MYIILYGAGIAHYTEKKDLIDAIKWENWIFFNWIN